jgi:hypothetical protein
VLAAFFAAAHRFDMSCPAFPFNSFRVPFNLFHQLRFEWCRGVPAVACGVRLRAVLLDNSDQENTLASKS